MSRAEEKACFVPCGGKASGVGSLGTWVQKVYRRGISELCESIERTWLGIGGWRVGRAGARATFAACG